MLRSATAIGLTGLANSFRLDARSASPRSAHACAGGGHRRCGLLAGLILATRVVGAEPWSAPVATGQPIASAGFAVVARPIPDALRAKMRGTSWHPECPVGLDDLRLVTLRHWNFEGAIQIGQVVVHLDVVDDIAAVFQRAFDDRFPVRQMRLIDEFGGDDFASIEAGNTSAFNCRRPTGSSSRWSRHAYGRAIDVNPIENPYVYPGGRVAHTASVSYVDRADVRPGMAVEGGGIVAAFDAVGWGWGGRWSGAIDYQHFSRDGH